MNPNASTSKKQTPCHFHSPRYSYGNVQVHQSNSLSLLHPIPSLHYDSSCEKGWALLGAQLFTTRQQRPRSVDCQQQLSCPSFPEVLRYPNLTRNCLCCEPGALPQLQPRDYAVHSHELGVLEPSEHWLV